MLFDTVLLAEKIENIWYNIYKNDNKEKTFLQAAASKNPVVIHFSLVTPSMVCIPLFVRNIV